MIKPKEARKKMLITIKEKAGYLGIVSRLFIGKRLLLNLLNGQSPCGIAQGLDWSSYFVQQAKMKVAERRALRILQMVTRVRYISSQ